MTSANWRVEVTDADIRAGRDAWRAARDGGAPESRVAVLRDSYERLVRAQARQLTEELQALHERSRAGTGEPGTGHEDDRLSTP